MVEDCNEKRERAAEAPSTPVATLRLEQVCHGYGSDPVLEGVNLSVSAGEIVCLLGASGSGKSTLLRIIAGLEPLQAGAIFFDGAELARPGREPPPEARRFGLVFQDHVLFPHLTVGGNVAFGLRGHDAREREARVAGHLRQVGLEGYGDRYPHTLSGGEQQRVALARALAPEPVVMLLDEPFASVDATLRRRLREDARRALRASGVPSIIVTHDAREAMEVADRIAVLHRGRILQDDTPAAVWRTPAVRFIPELLGESNAIDGTGAAGGIETRFGRVDLHEVEIRSDEPYLVIVRAGSVQLAPGASGDPRVVDTRFLGDRHLVTLEAGDERLRTLHATEPGVAPGERVRLAFDPAGVLVYHKHDNDSHLPSSSGIPFQPPESRFEP